MGSRHHDMDSYNSIHLPPTFHSTSASQASAARPQQTSVGQQIHNGDTDSNGQNNTNGAKTETEGVDKPKPVRKKRGQYKKTILRQQQQQAAALAAAAAAGLPPPELSQPPQPASSTTSKTMSNIVSASNRTTSQEQHQQHQQHQQHSSTIESLNVRQSKSVMDHSRRTALEMERELAMLAEEAEEDRKRRDEEAADRILKRAQVVNHLRSLKSKLASAQIQIGQDLHYQSVDLFSDIFDEVLEDIGKDNSEMLELIKQSHLDGHDDDDDDNARVKIEPTAEQLGHMPTRSSGRPKKRDLISSVPRPHKLGSRDQHNLARSFDLDHDSDLEEEEVTVKRYRRGKGGERFVGVGQSWDVGGGGEESAAPPSSNIRSKVVGHGKARRMSLEDEMDDDDDDVIEIEGLKRLGSNGTLGGKSAPRTREELQHQHRLELEKLQLQQRKDQEEFQRRQLEQLRDLQMRQNEEFRLFEAAKAKRYRERLEAMTDNRAKFIQPSPQHGMPRSNKMRESSRSLSYEFDNGFEHDSAQEFDDSSSSRSPSPSPQPTSSRSRETISSSSSYLIPNRGTPAPRPRQSQSQNHSHGRAQPLAMSTMTMALTAMNEKKKQMKRAQRKQPSQEDHHAHGQSDESAEDSDYHQHLEAKTSRQHQFPHGGQKRSAPDNSADTRKRSASATPTLQVRSSSNSHSRIHYEPMRSDQGPSAQLRHFARESPPLDRYEHHQPTQPRSSIESHTQSSKPRTKKQKQDSPTSTSTSAQTKGHAEEENGESKPAIGFNKTLLSHFDRWNPDTKTENFFDFVLSDPPDVEVDDSEVEGLLNRVKQPAERAQSKDMNVTPTSNAFRWYQEQQKLAQELARQPKIKPLSFENLGDNDQQGTSSTDADPLNPFGANTAPEELTLGEDPLAAFTPKNRKTQESQSAGSHAGTSLKHGAADIKNGVTMSQIPDSSSPMIGSSPAMNMLYSDDGEHDWGFNPFMVDSTDDYIHQDSPLQSSQPSEDFELQF